MNKGKLLVIFMSSLADILQAISYETKKSLAHQNFIGQLVAGQNIWSHVLSKLSQNLCD